MCSQCPVSSDLEINWLSLLKTIISEEWFGTTLFVPFLREWKYGTLTWWWLAESRHQCLTGDMAGWSKSHELRRCVVRFTAIGCVLCTYCCICMVCVGEQCFDCCKSCNLVHSPNVNCHQWSAWFLALHVTSNFVVSVCRPHSAYKHFFCLHAMASVCWKVQIPVMHLWRLFASHPTATVCKLPCKPAFCNSVARVFSVHLDLEDNLLSKINLKPVSLGLRLSLLQAWIHNFMVQTLNKHHALFFLQCLTPLSVYYFTWAMPWFSSGRMEVCVCCCSVQYAVNFWSSSHKILQKKFTA